MHHVADGDRARTRARVLGAFFARMDAGVSVFFVLSGFLLYRPFVAAHLADRPRAALRAVLVAPVPAHRARLLARADLLHRHRDDLGPDVAATRLPLRVRADLLEGPRARRAGPGVEPLRRDHLLPLPAACSRSRSASSRSRWPAASGSRSPSSSRCTSIGVDDAHAAARHPRRVDPGHAVVAVADRPVRARHVPRGDQRVDRAARGGAALGRRPSAAHPWLCWIGAAVAFFTVSKLAGVSAPTTRAG